MCWKVWMWFSYTRDISCDIDRPLQKDSVFSPLLVLRMWFFVLWRQLNVWPILRRGSRLSFFTAKLPKASPRDIRNVCMSAGTENFRTSGGDSSNDADENSPTSPPCRWLAINSLPTHAKVQVVWRRLCDVRFLFPCQFEHTLTAVCALTRISIFS